MSVWPEWKIEDFSGGYIDKIDNTKLPANVLKDCRNIISRQIGRVSKRYGQARLNSKEIDEAGIQGLHAFYLGSAKYLVTVAGGNVYCCKPPLGTMTLLKSGLDATEPVLFVTAYIDGKNQIIGFNGVNTPFKWDGVEGTYQIETATVEGTITFAGDLSVVVTAEDMDNSPITLSVAVDVDDTASIVAGKIRDAMEEDDDIAGIFNIGGTDSDIVLTFKVKAENDSTINIAISNGTADGITEASISDNTVAGVAIGISDLNDYRSIIREEPSTNDFTTYALANKPVRQGSDRFFVFSNNELLDYEDYTLDAIGGEFTFSSARVNTVSSYTADDAQAVTYPLNGRIEALHPFKVGCTVTVYDKDGNALKALTDENAVDDWKADYAAGVVAAPLTLDFTNLMPLAVTYQWTDVIKVDYQYSNGTVPSQLRYPVKHKGRIFVMAGDERIYWSDINENGNEYESWPPVNYWPVNQGNGDGDGCLISLMNELFIFMNRSIHRFRGNDLEDFRLEPVANVGCAGPRAAYLDDSNVYFISEQGVYTFNGMDAVNISRGKIPFLWERVNKPYLYQSAVHAWQGLILFSVPLDESTTNNIVIVLDSTTGAFWLWDSMEVAMWVEIATTSGLKLYSGKTTEGYILEQNIGDNDEGANIACYLEPAVMNAGVPDKLKKARYVYIEHGENQSVTWAELFLSKDYETAVEVSAVSADGPMRKYSLRPEISDKWRYMGLRITHDKAGGFDLRSVVIPYKAKTKPNVKGEVE